MKLRWTVIAGLAVCILSVVVAIGGLYALAHRFEDELNWLDSDEARPLCYAGVPIVAAVLFVLYLAGHRVGRGRES